MCVPNYLYHRLPLIILLLAPVLFFITGNAQSDSLFTNLHGKYLGQKTPGMQAEIFAKGIVSTDAYEHSAPAFSPGGNVVLWGTVERDKPSVLWEMRREGDNWTKPAIASFCTGKFDDMYPRFSVDGGKLFFSSRRPLPQGQPVGDIRIWVVDKNAGGWGEPYLFDTAITAGFEYAHSATRNGDFYFSARKAAGDKITWGIYCSKFTNGQYQSPRKLDTSINNGNYVDGPCVAPDGSFLIFESDRAGGIGSTDLYICFKQAGDTWGRPVNMGPKVNSSFAERFAGLSPDGKYLFFGSNRGGALPDVYWIDARIIKEIRKRADK